ncbi:hypothetical protein C8R43DRAFT_978379 [Mycena crocata]|nr:hypothetical protein C8R43DRAFT_978379 [Mycena crocata]
MDPSPPAVASAPGEAPTPANVGNEPEAPLGAKPARLTFAYLSPASGEGTRYAVVPFPKSYADAIKTALAVLGRHMTDPRDDNIILKYSAKNREGDWIWADIEPGSWSLVVQPFGEEVGVFEKRTIPSVFWQGPVYLLMGSTRDDGETTWEKNDTRSMTKIDRPASHAEAVERVKQTSRFKFGLSGSKEVFKFYMFESTPHGLKWIPFPAHSTTDDTVWKLLAPEPYSILGVIIS